MGESHLATQNQLSLVAKPNSAKIENSLIVYYFCAVWLSNQ